MSNGVRMLQLRAVALSLPYKSSRMVRYRVHRGPWTIEIVDSEFRVMAGVVQTMDGGVSQSLREAVDDHAARVKAARRKVRR